jgi:hypothetical protein
LDECLSADGSLLPVKQIHAARNRWEAGWFDQCLTPWE